MKIRTLLAASLLATPIWPSLEAAPTMPASPPTSQPTATFPMTLEYVASNIYRHRSDGTVGREIRIRFKDAKVTAPMSLQWRSDEHQGELQLTATPEGLTEAVFLLPPGVSVERDVQLFVTVVSGKKSLRQSFIVHRQRQWTVYIYPHSHVDIGYTNLQSNVEIIHKRNLVNGMRLAKATANYPAGARYVWNPEVIWPVERYLKTASAQERAEVLDGITKGYVRLDCGYVNVNTTVTADEEFPTFFRFAKEMESATGVKIDTLVQTDIPGMSWGLVPMAAQHGIRYVFAPFNGGDRTGNSPEASFRPFWWIGPDGQSKVLFLQPGDYAPGAWAKGFAYWPKMAGQKDPEKLLQIVKTDHPREHFIDSYLWPKLTQLEQDPQYPYDLFPMTWAMADNTPIDADLPEAVKSWNEEYAFPHLIIAGSHDIMRAFEDKYGSVLPTYRGDYTEYWSDGLGTASLMNGLNRNTKERLIQTDMLWAMLYPDKSPPRSDMAEAWRKVLMGSEHTYCYMNPKQTDMQNEIWKVKQDYFKQADESSRTLMASTLAPVTAAGSAQICVFNTLSWKRSGVVRISAQESRNFQGVANEAGQGVAAQRLSSGELAFLASDIPALGAAHYQLTSTPYTATSPLKVAANGLSLENEFLTVTLDAQSGDIISLQEKRGQREFVAPNSPGGVNSYRYLLGRPMAMVSGPQYAAKAQSTTAPQSAASQAHGPTEVKISLRENGPLLASLFVEAQAPGCNSLTREVRLIAGEAHVELDNWVDKIATTTKEGIHFGFPFAIDNPRTRVDIPLGIMELEADQLPFANRNWICFQRWLDISNADAGVTWCSLDAPTFESGAMSANIIGPGTRSPEWIRYLPPSATIYSWALNNHWHTNYPLFQEGRIPFRYRLLPHTSGFDAVTANRFGLESARPLLATTVGEKLTVQPRVLIDNPKVFVSMLKNAADGQILRLRSVSSEPETFKLIFPQSTPRAILVSDATERSGPPVEGTLNMLPYGVLTLKLQF